MDSSFLIGTHKGLRPVNLKFAGENDVRRIRDWRRKLRGTDAGEFAALAAKRWFYYARENSTATSFEILKAQITANPAAEVAFLLVASAEWSRGYLAIAYCRRSWCHHLILDFLAVHPDVRFRQHPVRGVGSGVLLTLVSLCEELGINRIWGESTARSSGFYAKTLRAHVDDLFIIRAPEMRRIRQRYLRDKKHLLATTQT